MRDAAQDHAETGGRFALSRPGMDDDKPLFAGFGRHDLVAGGLFLGHLDRVAGIICRQAGGGFRGIFGGGIVAHLGGLSGQGQRLRRGPANEKTPRGRLAAKTDTSCRGLSHLSDLPTKAARLSLTLSAV